MHNYILEHMYFYFCVLRVIELGVAISVQYVRHLIICMHMLLYLANSLIPFLKVQLCYLGNVFFFFLLSIRAFNSIHAHDFTSFAN